MSHKNAVLLLSGGLDSTTLLALATRENYRVHALSFQYGQRHSQEIEVAQKIARRYQVARHEVVNIDLRVFGGSALTSDIAVPKDRVINGAGRGPEGVYSGSAPLGSPSSVSTPFGDRIPGTTSSEYAASEHRAPATSEIPVTYVPARNTIFLSYALAFAEVTSSTDIFIGVNSLDYSGYPDCRPEYIAAFEKMANLATRAGVEDTGRVHIRAPFLNLTKRGIIELGLSLGVDYSQTVSCYDPDPDGAACGHCDACQLRLKGFADAGHTDPTRYAKPHP